MSKGGDDRPSAINGGRKIEAAGFTYWAFAQDVVAATMKPPNE